MIKVDMSTGDLDKQLYLLKYYPEFFKKHVRPVLYSLTGQGMKLVLAGVPRRTGKAAGAIRRKVSGAGIAMEGHYGWYGNNMPWYINVVEHGAVAHEIKLRKPGGWLHFGSTFTKVVNHPGFAKVGFMAAAYASLQPVMDAELLRANEAVLQELVV